MTEWQPLENAIKEIMEREQIPGAAVAITRDNEVIFAKGFGKANIENNKKVTPNTIFGTASITKSFTALAIMKLVEEGKLALDDSVKQHLPQFELSGYENVEAIKIHHLLSHTTGIPTIERKEQLKEFTEHLLYLKEADIQPLGEPGAYFCYNNDMFLLLGAIIEKVTGMNYKEFIKKEIILPSEMHRTTFELSEVAEYDDVATPYVFENESLKKCAWPTLGNYAAGGGIRSTVLDLVKYGQIYLKESNIMSQPVHQTHGTRSYGYGLHITPNYGDVTLVEHGGGQPGVSSNFGFIPEENIVIAVLTNVSGVNAGDIWLCAANAALGIPLTCLRSIEPHYHMKEYELPKFIGTYQTGEGAVIEISSAIGQLQATVEGKNYMLRASNEETLVLKPIEEPIRFYFNENDEAWALFYGLRMYVKKEE
ncbi:serine hydrolase [Sporosarcina pasteurii]|uniref:Penicillin-binding protein E n=1 Tax=Sporosarcina pasteurii TaxID=1474 RepID=A0A380C7J9_SPOPA|nr:serine hydrolase domain-containing protein [Sporosarcina pasteurii]MDS9472997.1 serine hydrolase domain-containing protein [Sporosarcina pasteurii]QBQ04509.1 class A beta-lactamase-related serine hydrolase [Sporosarcina pasteurii]SUJ14444.1 Penicillin-binding protein E [Sporosarcina pasteurii]